MADDAVAYPNADGISKVFHVAWVIAENVPGYRDISVFAYDDLVDEGLKQGTSLAYIGDGLSCEHLERHLDLLPGESSLS